jgi:hypothetical protein
VDFVVCTLAVKKKIRAGFDMSDRTIPLSVTQDILLRVWDELSYRLDVIRAAGGEHIDHL